MDIHDRGRRLIELHTAPEILQVVNVWDAASARVVAQLPETKALATASHSIAAVYGYPDGEHIPLDLMLDMVGRIIAMCGNLPVSADLEAGYGNAGEAVRQAIAVGAVGANLEDELRPLPEAVAAVEAAVAAADEEGVPFALNARTDAFALARDRPTGEVVADAIERGQAYLDAGATCVFMPGKLTEEEVEEVVAALGPQKISVIGAPGAQASGRFEQLGVARISYGPWTHRVALTALDDVARELYAGGVLPLGTRPLN
jgi:2-methylisocitrate lyase-like PEP mutase family enzyme